MREKSNNSKWKIIIATSVILVLVVGVIGIIYAALTDTTAVVENGFEPAVVACEVQDQFDGTTKSDVSVKNTGNIPAYIRVKVVVNWVDSNGNTVFTINQNDYNYQAVMASPLNWTSSSGSGLTANYWYFNGIVQPGENTDDLIASITEVFGENVAANPRYRLNVTVMADAIQAAPDGATSAVGESWGMTFDGSSWTPVG